jgi:hypothetical protein
VTALAIAMIVLGLFAFIAFQRWLSLTYESTPEVTLDPAKVNELSGKVAEHESKLNALMLERGLRTSKESRA